MAAACVLASSCSSKPKVIPEDDFARIYADMFAADQLIAQSAMNRMADTSLVYEPIFRKYGYTTDDYRTSSLAYLKKPKEYAKVYKKAAELLKARIDALTIDQRREFARDSINRIMDMKHIRRPEIYYGMAPEAVTEFDLDKKGGLYLAEPVSPEYEYSGLEKIGRDPDDNKGFMDEEEEPSMLDRPGFVAPRSAQPGVNEVGKPKHMKASNEPIDLGRIGDERLVRKDGKK